MLVFTKQSQSEAKPGNVSAGRQPRHNQQANQQKPAPVPVQAKTVAKQEAKLNDNASTLATGISSLSEYVTKPLTDKIYQEIDKVTDDIRAKLAKEQKINPKSVKQLDVAEYLLAMPTSGLNKPINDMTASLRNSILIGFAGVCIVLYITRSKDALSGR